jgi:hypothetical protein
MASSHLRDAIYQLFSLHFIDHPTFVAVRFMLVH